MYEIFSVSFRASSLAENLCNLLMIRWCRLEALVESRELELCHMSLGCFQDSALVVVGQTCYHYKHDSVDSQKSKPNALFHLRASSMCLISRFSQDTDACLISECSGLRFFRRLATGDSSLDLFLFVDSSLSPVRVDIGVSLTTLLVIDDLDMLVPFKSF